MTTRLLWPRRSALAALTAGLAAPALGQPPGAVIVSPPLSQAPADRPPAGGGALLETAFDRAMRLTVPVYLNGKGPFAFVVDTGANRSVVSIELAAACGLADAGSAPVHGIIAIEPARLVEVGRLRVGEVISSGLRLPSLSQVRMGAAGILGLDVLQGRRILLGFGDQTFQIAASSSGADIGRGVNSRVSDPYQPVTVPARMRSGQLVIIDAEAAGRGITAFLDSGSQVTVANGVLKRSALAAVPELANQIFRSELISATGQRAPAEFAPLPGLRLGGQLLDSPLVAFADLHIFDLWGLRDRPTVLIGVDILRRFEQVAFDFGRKRITFWPLRPHR
ncbi:MAG: hypothetical protein JWQ46_2190 [Phenylobacterium sp.]|jgi:hypothetical protein|nr:hypothetical protein [Phenylobacterium sp.]